MLGLLTSSAPTALDGGISSHKVYHWQMRTPVETCFRNVNVEMVKAGFMRQQLEMQMRTDCARESVTNTIWLHVALLETLTLT